MPRGDRTGPAGAGPRTGRGAGFCAGFTVPGFLDAGSRGGRGRGGGWGAGGRVRGRGHWGGAGRFGPPAALEFVEGVGEEPADLRRRMEDLTAALEVLNRRLEALEEGVGEGEGVGRR